MSPSFTILGGGGFVGYRLALFLSSRFPDCRVQLLDVSPPVLAQHPTELTLAHAHKLKFTRCDLRDLPSLTRLLSDFHADSPSSAVFHFASYGMSGSQMLETRKIYEINVHGTENVIEACKSIGIPILIYISTYNTVFGGKTIENGREMDLPFYPLEQYVEQYSKTKQLAERKVLENHLAELDSSAVAASSDRCPVLLTLSLRPAAIYGDGENRHFPRILSHCAAGLALFSIGHPSLLCDWVFVDNFVESCIRAFNKCEAERKQLAMKQAKTPRNNKQNQNTSNSSFLHPISPLTSSSSSSSLSLMSRAYFISDCNPVNNFAFLGEIIRGLGYQRIFLFSLPTSLMWYIALCFEWIHWLLSPFFTFTPFLSRAEVEKVGVTHYMSGQKAAEELGYRPIVKPEQAVQRCVKWFRDNGYAAESQPPLINWRPVDSLLLLIGLLAFITALAGHSGSDS